MIKTLTVLCTIAAYSLYFSGIEAQQVPAFEVSTIKPNPLGYIDLGGGVRVLSGRTYCRGADTKVDVNSAIPMPPLGRCSVLNSTVKEIIDSAYDLHFGPPRNKVNQFVVGGPGWAGTEAYDIQAKAEDESTATEAQLHLMLRSLLADRFQLKFHRETREMSGFALVIAKNGSKLQEADASERPGLSVFPQVRGQSVPIASLIYALTAHLSRPISDQTGLSGKYDFALSWAPDENEVGPTGAPIIVTANPTGPSITTALQEQLGLELRAETIKAEVVVIDSVQRPSES